MLVLSLIPRPHPAQGQTLFDTAEIEDTTTLAIAVVDDWHADGHMGITRQKLVEISVAEWWADQDYSIPVRLIVPLSQPASGLWVSSGHPWGSLDADVQLSPLEAQLITAGLGLLQTIVIPLEALPGGVALQSDMLAHFGASLDFRHLRAWIWPMTLMRALTWAHTETAHVDGAGRVFASGSSKNGMSAATALINDSRFTGAFAQVTPAWSTAPRRLEADALAEVEVANVHFAADVASGAITLDPATDQNAAWYQSFALPNEESYLFYTTALAAGWSEAELMAAWQAAAPSYLASEHWSTLQARGVQLLFEPGTHDWVAFDVLEGGEVDAEIPIYLEANGGHAMSPHPQAEADSQNLEELVRRHFLAPAGTPDIGNPGLSWMLAESSLDISVDGSGQPAATTGRLWWLYDRDPSGSAGYLWKRIPDDNWADLVYDAVSDTWQASIALESGHSQVDLFANLGMDVVGNRIYRSTPYTRVSLPVAAAPLAPAIRLALIALLLGSGLARVRRRG